MAGSGLRAKNETNQMTFGDEDLRRTMELLFFAYRDFTGDADTLLADFGFGRAHHRVIYFVGRHPGMSVSELLDILKITKQSLSRVLGQLIGDGFIYQRTDTADRRRRRLYLAARGAELERRLTKRQSSRIADAFEDAGGEAAKGFCTVLRAIINEEDRRRVAEGELPPHAGHTGGEAAE